MKRARKKRGIDRIQELRLFEGAALSIFVIAILGSFGIAAIQSEFMRSDQSAAVVASVLVDLANSDRAAQHLGALTMNPLLVHAAQEKADDEAAKGYFAHISPDGKDSWYWFKDAGYEFSYAGENLAVDFSDSGDVNTAWMNSPTHRENLLNPHFTEIGIAVAQGMYEGHPTTFVVQMFGAPALASRQSEIAVSSIPSEPTKIAVASVSATGSPQEKVLGSAVAPGKTAQDPATSQEVLRRVPTPPVVEQPMPRYAFDWGLLITSPHMTLRVAFYAIGFAVLLALFMTTRFEFRVHHARTFAAAGALFVLMSCLFILADALVFGQPSVAVASTQQAS